MDTSGQTRSTITSWQSVFPSAARTRHARPKKRRPHHPTDMADRISKETRSRLMSRIKLSNTGPELVLRRALWSAGMRYRLKARVPLPGRPDIVFPGARVAVFVDGCFWHGCPIHGHIPKSREEYWEPKIARTLQRDSEANARLTAMGWGVLRFWEHQVRDETAKCVADILALVRPDGFCLLCRRFSGLGGSRVVQGSQLIRTAK